MVENFHWKWLGIISEDSNRVLAADFVERASNNNNGNNNNNNKVMGAAGITSPIGSPPTRQRQPPRH